MKKEQILGAVLAGVMAVTGVPQTVGGLAVSAGAETVSVSEKLAAPKNITSVSKTDKIKLSWDAAEGADGYRVYLYIREEKKYISVGNTKKTSYVVDYLMPGTTYSFKVAALVKSGSKYTAQTLSDAYKAVTLLDATSGISIQTNFEERAVNMEWKEVEGADAYAVYMKTGENGKFKRLKVVKGTKYTVTGLVEDEYYYFKIMTLKKQDGKYIPQGTTNSEIGGQLSDPTPALEEATKGNKKFDSLISFPAMGTSQKDALKQLGITNYEEYDENNENGIYVPEGGKVITAICMVGGEAAVVALNFAQDKLFNAGETIIPTTGSYTYEDAVRDLTERLGEPDFDRELDFFGEPYGPYLAWADKKNKEVELIGSGFSMITHQIISKKYAPKDYFTTMISMYDDIYALV